jgi:hypothetical protein
MLPTMNGPAPTSVSKKAAIIAIALVILAALLIGVRVHDGGRARLLRYKAQLRANGDKLTFIEIAIPPSTNPEHNLSRQLFASNAYVPGGASFAAPGPIPKLMEFVAPGVARVSWRGPLFLDVTPGVTNGPSIGDWAEFERENEGVAAELSKFKQALEHPAPDTGWIYQDTFQNVTNAPVRFYFRHRAVAYALVNAEIASLHRSNLDAAIGDLHALAGLARLNRNEPILLISMFRTVVAELGLRGVWEALQAPNWDEPRLAALQRDWEQVNLFDALERGFLGERAGTQVIMDAVRSARGPKIWELLPGGYISPRGSAATNNFFLRCWKQQIIPLVYKLTTINEDELVRWQHLTKEVEIARLLKSNHPWPEVSASNSIVWKELNATFDRKRRIPLLASAYTIQNSQSIPLRAVQVETLRRLAITAIAIKRYELRHAEPPPDLAALVPAFLAGAPIDPMSGKPLCYRRNPDSTFTLYSVGEDGKDDGGCGGTSLWTGLDALWPTVVTSAEASSGQPVAASLPRPR